MLPTVFDVEPPSKKERKHQAEKPVELLAQIMEFITNEKEWVLDQFAGSFTTAEAALENERNSISIEINPEYFEEGKKRIQNVNDRVR